MEQEPKQKLAIEVMDDMSKNVRAHISRALEREKENPIETWLGRIMHLTGNLGLYFGLKETKTQLSEEQFKKVKEKLDDIYAFQNIILKKYGYKVNPDDIEEAEEIYQKIENLLVD
jgi:flagellin-specific chaperone FliS